MRQGGRESIAVGAGVDRRSFFAVGGGAALLCTLGGKTVEIRSPEDVERLDAAAARLARPVAAQPEPVDRAQFPTPQPQPGGQTREYWLAARAIRWDLAPSGRDEWMNHPLPRRRTMRAFVYQPFSAGFAHPVGRPPHARGRPSTRRSAT